MHAIPREKIVQIIAKITEVKGKNVHLQSRLVADLGFDSLDCLTMVLDLENQLGVILPDEQIETLATVGQVVELVLACMAGSEEAA
jgi:acyl carrier protein